MKRIYLVLIYLFCWGTLSAQVPIDEIAGGLTSSLSHTGEVMAVGFTNHVKIYGSITSFFSATQIGSDIPYPDTPLVSISGDGNRVGIVGENLATMRVYDRVNDDWVQIGTDINFTNGGTHKNSISISPDGNRIALGGATNTVQVYELIAGNWTQVGTDLQGEDASDGFGTAVALSADGNILAVGAPHNNNANGLLAGHVRVFEWSESSWIQMGADIDGLYEGDQFGTSVALSNNGMRFVAGAPYYDANGEGSWGYLRVLNYTNDMWASVHNLIDGLRAGSTFGYSVDISADGNRITGVGTMPTTFRREYVAVYQVFQVYNSSDQWKAVGGEVFAMDDDEDFSSVTMAGNGNRIGFTKTFEDASHVDVYGLFIVLPIELTHFQAQIQNKTTLLTWQTATETHNSGFEIQRSKDGTTWQKIGWQEGQGDTQTPHDYTHTDESPRSGTSYYRLKQIDFDGAFSYSDIVKVDYASIGISIYPNPVKNTLHIADLNDKTIQNITIFDQMGRQILLQNTSVNTLDVSALSSGVYIIQVVLDSGVFSDRFIVK